MKFLKKLFPLLVIVTILLSVAIIPASADDVDASDYEGHWFYLDASYLPTNRTVLLQGRFLLPAYDFHGTYFDYDFSSYRSFKSLYWDGSSLRGVLTNGSVQELGTYENIFGYNRFIFVESFHRGSDNSVQSVYFEFFDWFEKCNTLVLDGLTIPCPPGIDFSEFSFYIPNFAVFDQYVSYRFPYDPNWYSLYGNGNELVYAGDYPSDYFYTFTTNPSETGGILTGFGAISTWITTALGSLDGIFFANGALTPLGILCIFSLAIGLAFLLFNVVKNFLEMRS